MKAIQSLASALALTAGLAAAAAAQVNFIGTTTFAFNGSGVFGNQTYHGLTVQNGTFSVFTPFASGDPDDAVGFGNAGMLKLNAVPPGFNFTDTNTVASGSQHVSIQVKFLFTQPTTGDLIFSHTISGDVETVGGGINIAWSNVGGGDMSEAFTTLLLGTGTFTLHLNDIGVTEDNQNPLSGSFLETTYTGPAEVDVSSTPEPATLGLLALGLAGVFGVARRRRPNS